MNAYQLTDALMTRFYGQSRRDWPAGLCLAITTAIETGRAPLLTACEEVLPLAHLAAAGGTATSRQTGASLRDRLEAAIATTRM